MISTVTYYDPVSNSMKTITIDEAFAKFGTSPNSLNVANIGSQTSQLQNLQL